MIRSMTGYGRCQELASGYDITAEIRAVNHRYFEFSVRTTRGYSFLDEKLKAFTQQRASRGKIDLYVSIRPVESGEVTVELNKPLAAGYLGALRQLGDEFGVTDDVTASSIARFTEIFTVNRVHEDEDLVWSAVSAVVGKAVGSFIEMREREGANMLADISARLDSIMRRVEQVDGASPETLGRYEARLRQKMEELLDNKQIDEQRLLTECALFADRIAVDEETVRLKSHAAQFRSILQSGEPAGRKLDFLMQEMNREANTIGSKCQNTEIAYIVVDIKTELEKIREQIQNIE
ncbi:MAG: YicC family protein [Oscillospiraceae bacterium]|nr:YicC family protein [Oscillospiraceae bacterium]